MKPIPNPHVSDLSGTKEKVYVIGAGRISGTFADSFHRVSESGKIGYSLDRRPSPDERKQLLADIRRHREILVQELTSLASAERILLKK